LFRAYYSGIIRNDETREVFESLIVAVQQLNASAKESIMNNLEKIILDETEDIVKVNLHCSTKDILSKIKVIGVYVQRNDPLEFNKLLNIVLGAA